jgi:hypothetical protein
MTINRSTNRVKRKKRSVEPTIWLAIITGLATIIAAFLQFYGNYLTTKFEFASTATAVASNRTSTPSPTKTPTAGTIPPTTSGTITLKDQVSTLESEVSLLQTQVAANGDVKQEVDSVSNRLGEMESLVETSPSEAMSYVVLRKELDEARSDIKDLESRQTSSWTQNIPLYGLVATVGFTLFSILRSDRKQNLEQSRNNDRNRERREDQRFE